MSDLVPKIGLAIENFKARQQDIIGLGHRAYKDLFAAANASMLTTVVQSLIRQSYAEMVTANPPRTSLLAAVSQQHAEIMAGCRVLTADDGILSALFDAANAATAEAFHMIYAEKPKVAAPSDAGTPTKKKRRSGRRRSGPITCKKNQANGKKASREKKPRINIFAIR
jgi:hypothetical protein